MTDTSSDGNGRGTGVRRLQHVSVPRPGGSEAHRRAVAFYQDLLGLKEIPKPSTFTDIDVTWFQIGDSEIHVYASGADEPLPHSGPHFCLVVADLQSARVRLEAAGHECAVPTEIPGRPRFNTQDPWGNQIEITVIERDSRETTA